MKPRKVDAPPEVTQAGGDRAESQARRFSLKTRLWEPRPQPGQAQLSPWSTVEPQATSGPEYQAQPRSSAVCPSGGLFPTLACNPASLKPKPCPPAPPPPAPSSIKPKPRQLPGVEDAPSPGQRWPLLAGRRGVGVEQVRAAPRSPSASFLHLPHRSHGPHRTHSLSIQQTSWVPRRWGPWPGSPCSAGWRP